jgi:hypothetical protein
MRSDFSLQCLHPASKEAVSARISGHLLTTDLGYSAIVPARRLKNFPGNSEAIAIDFDDEIREAYLRKSSPFTGAEEVGFLIGSVATPLSLPLISATMMWLVCWVSAGFSCPSRSRVPAVTPDGSAASASILSRLQRAASGKPVSSPPVQAKGRDISLRSALIALAMLLGAALAGPIARELAKATLSPLQRTSAASSAPEAKKADILRTLREFLPKINADLPKMLDDFTRLDEARIDGETITYYHTWLNADAAVGRANWHELSKKACDSKLRFILDAGVTASYAFRDRSGAVIDTVRITKSDCMP